MTNEPGTPAQLPVYRPSRAIVQLRLVIVGFIVVLTIPLVWLVIQVQEKFENEVFYQYRQGADDVVNTINSKLEDLIGQENSRAYDDYTFSRSVPLPNNEGVRVELSPLAEYPPSSAIPGMLGYFQVDPDGTLRSPLVPTAGGGTPDLAALGISSTELANRLSAYETLSQELVAGGFALTSNVSAPTSGASGGAAPKPIPSPTSAQSISAPGVADRRGAEQDLARQRDSAGDKPLSPMATVLGGAGYGGAQPHGEGSGGAPAAEAPSERKMPHDGSLASNRNDAGVSVHAPRADANVSGASGEPRPKAETEREEERPHVASTAGQAPSGAAARGDVSPPHRAPAKTMNADEIADVVVKNRMGSQMVQQELLLEERVPPEVLQNNLPVSKLNLDSKLYEKQAYEQQTRAKTKDDGGRGIGGKLAPSKGRYPSPEVANKKSMESADGESAAVFASRGPFGEDRSVLQKKDAPVSSRPIKEESLLAASEGRGNSAPPVRVLDVGGEVDPLVLRFVGETRILLLRKVWRDGKRYLQGFALDAGRFFDQTVSQPFEGSPLAEWSTMIIGYRGVFFRRVRGQSFEPLKKKADDREIVLTRRTLSPPFDSLEILIAAPVLPESAGRGLVDSLAIVTLLIMLLGSWSIYRLGAKQIHLAKERSDFVSAVSHELKTPLTSIRMYGDMLRSGWVTDEAKRQSYYEFIVSESERLSRLIANVLHLSRLSNSDGRLELKPVTPKRLLEMAAEKVATQIASVGFSLVTVLEPESAVKEPIEVLVEEDAFSRIAINLVDNALKFSVNAERREIVLRVRVGSGERPEVMFSVRDYGPGVPREEMKRIFRLFYRVEDEMRRNTPGTGIGLALVRELAARMDADVDLKNHEPGAEFRVVWRARRGDSRGRDVVDDVAAG